MGTGGGSGTHAVTGVPTLGVSELNPPRHVYSDVSGRAQLGKSEKPENREENSPRHTQGRAWGLKKKNFPDLLSINRSHAVLFGKGTAEISLQHS
jgi:hypothetical protein